MMKRQEQAYRKALINLLAASVDFSRDSKTFKEATQAAVDALDEAGTLTEMEQLAEWLVTKTMIPGRKDTYDTGYVDAMKETLYHIATEHGYGEET